MHVGDVRTAVRVDGNRCVSASGPAVVHLLNLPRRTVVHGVHQAGVGRVVVGYVLVSLAVQGHRDPVGAHAVALAVHRRYLHALGSPGRHLDESGRCPVRPVQVGHLHGRARESDVRTHPDRVGGLAAAGDAAGR